MRNTPHTRSGLSRLGKLAVAASLALAASASFAGALVNITSFTVSTSGDIFTPKYAIASGQTADISVSALNAGGLGGAASNTYSANAWVDAGNVTASTSNAQASGTPGKFTDPNTQLDIGIFSLSASSSRSFGGYATPVPPNTASANAVQTGQFSLIDGNGDATAGLLTFDIFYDLSVASLFGPPDDYDSASVNFSASTDEDGVLGNLSDLLLSYNFANGIGSVTSGRFTLTVDLAAGEVVYFDLSGTAFSSAAAIPEPGALALASVALLALGASRRRAKTMASTAV